MIERQGGPRDPLLDLKTEPPSRMVWIWNVFHELNGGRQFDAGHPQRMSHQEIVAWCALTDEKLKKRELRILHDLDVTWINTVTTVKRDLN